MSDGLHDAADSRTGDDRDGAFARAEQELLSLWWVPAPPSDFARRVLARADTLAARRRDRGLALAGVAAVALCVLALAGSAGRLGIPVSGNTDASERTTVTLGRRAVAVLEPGARIGWHTDVLGRASVEQGRGSVFYRVASGGAFVVDTPLGRVRVTGTCFRVEVQEMKASQSGAVGLVAGAVAASAVWVTVYEGSVEASSAAGSAQVRAGEQTRLLASAAPVVTTSGSDLDRAEAGVSRRPDSRLPPAPDAQQRAQAVLELEKLRTRVAELEESLGAEQAWAEEKRGKPADWPADLDERFGGEALRTAINAGFAEVGLDGEVLAVDCDEFPCIVIGEVKGSQFGREQATALEGTAALHPYLEDRHQSFGSTKEEDGRTRNIFGVALWPRSTDANQIEQLSKRIRYRYNELIENE